MSDKKDRIIRIIQALKAKTADRGATENEAMEAASKIAALMDQYDIAESDVKDAGEDALKTEAINIAKLWQELLIKCIAPSIGKLTGTLVVGRLISARRRVYEFIGADNDVLFAKWLAETIVDFVLSGLAGEEARRSFPSASARSAYRNGYLIGAGVRINTRIGAMLTDRNQVRASANLPALASKAMVIKDRLMAQGEKFQQGPNTFSGRVNSDGREAGAARGDAVQLGRPLGQQDQRAIATR